MPPLRSRFAWSRQSIKVTILERCEGLLSVHSLTIGALALALLALTPIGLAPSGDAARAPREVLSLRTATSNTYVDSKGKHRTRLYSQAINYRSGKTWKPIDNTLVKSKNENYAFENAANSFHVRFKDSLEDGYMRFDAPNSKASILVSLEKSASADMTTDGDTGVSYEDVRSQADIRYEVVGTGLKETVVLHDSSAPSDYVFDLEPTNGQDLTAEQQKDGSIVFYVKGDSQPAFAISAPTVADSAKNGLHNPPAAGKSSMKIEKKDGSFRLTVSIDPKWLSDPQRVFPVYLDPNYSALTQSDGFFNKANGVLDTTSTNLYVGGDGPGTYGLYATVATFDLGTIPVGSRITGVDTNVYLAGCISRTCAGGTTTANVQMRRLTSGWAPGTQWSQITKDSTVLASRNFNAGPGYDAINNWYGLQAAALPDASSLRSVIGQMVNGTMQNFGFALETPGSAGSYGFTFRSSRYGDPALAPYLDVFWQRPGVVVSPFPQLHGNGADLTWTRWNGTGSTYLSTASADNPTYYWRLGETSGTNAVDNSGTNSGTYLNSPTLGAAGALANDPNKAVTFDGTNDVVRMSRPVQLGSADFSVEAWFKTTTTGALQTIFRTGSNPGGAAMTKLEVNASNQLHFFVIDTAGLTAHTTSTAIVTNGAWHYAVGTRSGNVFTLYLDGVQVAQTTLAVGQTDSSSEVTTIGATMGGTKDTYSNFHTGSIDEVAVYPQALPVATVQAHYAAAPSPMPVFQRYEIHRSTTRDFTPSASTLVGTVASEPLQTFRDTTARPNTVFYYKVVVVTDAGTYSSNVITASVPDGSGLPADGISQITIQPGLVNEIANGTYIDSTAPTTQHAADQTMIASSTARALMNFDLRPIPSNVDIDSARLHMFSYQPNANTTINVHGVTSAWDEVATWEKTGPEMPTWTTPGGDFDSAVVDSVIDNSPVPHWDSWNVASLVQDWVSGAKAQNGFLLKHANENGAAPLAWVADGYTRSVALRPKLVVTYADPTANVIKPQVAISSPAPSSKVAGVVTIKAGASDDGRVASVQFRLDGYNLGAAVTSPPYEKSGNSGNFSRGNHTLTAVATDDAGNTTTSSAVPVNVANSNAPMVSVSATGGPGPNLITNDGFEQNLDGWDSWNADLNRSDAVSKSGNWSAKVTLAEDESGFGGSYEAGLSGSSEGRSFTVSTWVYVPSGSDLIDSDIYALARAVGGSAPEFEESNECYQLREGWQQISATHTISESDRTGIELHAEVDWGGASGVFFYLDNAEIHEKPDEITVTATASDDYGIDHVDFMIDGVRFARDDAAPWTVQLDTLDPARVPQVYDGTRTITAKAYDIDNYQTTSAGYPITVANTDGTTYKGTISTPNVPSEMAYDPASGQSGGTTPSVGPHGTLLRDKFNRSDGAPGADWSNFWWYSQPAINGNEIDFAHEWKAMRWSPESNAGPDSEAWMKVGSLWGAQKLAVRDMQDGEGHHSFYEVVIWDDGGGTIGKVVDSSDMVAIGEDFTGGTFEAGDYLAISAVDDTIEVWRWAESEAEWTLVTSATDSDITEQGSLAVMGMGKIDDFGGGTIGTGTTPSAGPYGTPFLDNVNRADGDPGSNWTGDVFPDEPKPLITTNAFDAGDDWSSMAWNATEFGREQEVWAKVDWISWQDVLYLGATQMDMSSSGSAYWVSTHQNGASHWVVGKIVNGNNTVLAEQSGGQSFASGDYVALVRLSDHLELWRFEKDGTAWAKLANISDNSLTDDGYLAFEIAGGSRYDDVGGGTINPETNPLVSIRNTSGQTWSGSDVKLRYRWLNPDGSEFSHSGNFPIGGDLADGEERPVTIAVSPPKLSANVMRGRFTLRIDLYDTSAGKYFAAQGNEPFEQTVTVTRRTSDKLGLERYQQYDGTDLGSGFGASVNLANGNLVVNSTLSEEPGIGLDTVVNLTYNSLENGSVSPVGNNWSLAISSLTSFGLPLDIHSDEGWVGFTDGDGTYHRFTLNESGNFYDAPAGVHLFLRETGSEDENRHWAATKPDRTTFYFDTSGYPTSVEDKNGNTISFTETLVPAGDDINGLARQITAVTDQGGRSYQIDYFDRSTSRSALRGKVSSIADHVGHKWVFAYYDDGNLMSVTEQGGANADGSYLADRTVTFNYTTSDGTGPAIETADDRKSPSPTTNQSTKLYSVIDARGNETSFAYFSADAKRWRVQQVTNRKGIDSSTYDYDLENSAATVVQKSSSDPWSYVFDPHGRMTSFTNPLGEKTLVDWTSDNEVSKVTEPTGETVQYTYNDNGYQTSKTDELGHKTTIAFKDLPVPNANDTGNHISRLVSVTKPNGNETTENPDDYMWTFEYSSEPDDTTDNVLAVTGPPPAGSHTRTRTTNTYKTDGTGLLATQTDAMGHTTAYNTYDANGLATRVTDPAENVSSAEYNPAGSLLWEQDPNHQSYSVGDPTHFRDYNYYDSFGRVGRTSSPKSTSRYPGTLIWDDTVYDANDNVLRDYKAHYGLGDGPGAPYTSTQYDALDNATLVTSPRGSQTQTEYDLAGRVRRVVDPKGIGLDRVAETVTSYDELDRVYQVTEYGVTDNGEQARTTTSCYDKAGDLRISIEPKATERDCPAAVVPYTYPENKDSTRFVYDAAHRQTRTYTTDGSKDGGNLIWKFTQTEYDANGQVTSTTDESGKTTTTTYDERGLSTKTVEPFDGDRKLTTITNYDPLGRVSSKISPRAYDAAGGSETYSEYVTSYSYDALNRLVKTILPTAQYGAARPSPYRLAVQADNPSHYWRLGERDGTTATDQKGSATNGTYRGGYTLGQTGALAASGETDSAVSFNGSSGDVSVPSGVELVDWNSYPTEVTLLTAPLSRYYDGTDHLTYTIDDPWYGNSHYETTLGYLFTEQVEGTVPINLCWYNNGTFWDSFTSPSGNCEGKEFALTLGYIYPSPPSNVPTHAIYRCRINGEHFDSVSSNCEGYSVEALLGYVANYSNVTVEGPPENVALSRSFTLEAWAKRAASGGYQFILSQGIAAVDQGLHFGFRENSTFTCGFYADDLTTAGTYTDSDWHHWVCTYDADTGARKLFRDGALIASDTAAGGYVGSGELRIGGLNWNGSIGKFNGTIDDVAIYDDVLSSVEVAQHNTAARQDPTSFVYQSYDANGNQTMVSLPTGATSAGAVAASDKTSTEYLDNGSIFSTREGSTGLTTRFDYTADGSQAARWPESADTPVPTVDYNRAMYWDYDSDGQLTAVRDLNGQRELFSYDANGNQTLAVEAAGIQQASQSPIRIERWYNGFDELTETRVPVAGYPGRYRASTFDYDMNGNTVGQIVNRQEDASRNPTAAYFSAVQSDNPSNYWRLGETSGNTATDQIGTARGTYQGGYALGQTGVLGTSGDNDSAASFNGSSSVVRLAQPVKFGSGDFSIEAWFKTSTTGVEQRILRTGVNPGGSGPRTSLYIGPDNRLGLMASDGATAPSVTSSATVTDGSWHYAVGTRSGSAFKLFLDGVQVAQTTATIGSTDSASETTTIGAALNSGSPDTYFSFFNGTLDEVAVYKHALSSSQVAGHYAAGTSPPPATPTGAGRVFAYEYDSLDQVTSQTDDWSSGTSKERLSYTYTATGELSSRTLYREPSTVEQKAEYSYYENGLLKTLTNSTGSSQVENHTLSYISDGVYQNGNTVSDTFTLLGPVPPNETPPCRTSTCVAKWSYDAQDRLLSEDPGTGGEDATSVFTLDTAGNVLNDGSTQSSYSAQKLTSQTKDGVTTKYLYDGFGNTACQVSSSWSSGTCPAAGNAALLQSYAYDYKNRQIAYTKYNGSGVVIDSASYVLDALDRTVLETETHLVDSTSKTTTTSTVYQGDSTAVAKETLTGDQSGTKTYAYDADGDAITLSDGDARYSYLYDPRSSVSLLVDSSGNVKESYGYNAYGSKNAAVTKSASGFSTGKVPTNPVRFQGKRLDSGSGSYDMGARRYSPSVGRWLQQDMYYGALDDLGLSQDPMTANRYAFLGANPVNYIEIDGHWYGEGAYHKAKKAAKAVVKAHVKVAKIAVKAHVEAAKVAVKIEKAKFQFRKEFGRGVLDAGRELGSAALHPGRTANGVKALVTTNPKKTARALASGLASEARSGYRSGGVAGAAGRVSGYIGANVIGAKGAGAGVRVASRAGGALAARNAVNISRTVRAVERADSGLGFMTDTHTATSIFVRATFVGAEFGVQKSRFARQLVFTYGRASRVYPRR